MGIACRLAFRESNDDAFAGLAYGLSIVTIIASEIVIGYWRHERDDGLRAVEARLSEARRQIDRPSSRRSGPGKNFAEIDMAHDLPFDRQNSR